MLTSIVLTIAGVAAGRAIGRSIAPSASGRHRTMDGHRPRRFKPAAGQPDGNPGHPR